MGYIAGEVGRTDLAQRGYVNDVGMARDDLTKSHFVAGLSIPPEQLRVGTLLQLTE